MAAASVYPKPGAASRNRPSRQMSATSGLEASLTLVAAASAEGSGGGGSGVGFGRSHADPPPRGQSGGR